MTIPKLPALTPSTGPTQGSPNGLPAAVGPIVAQGASIAGLTTTDILQVRQKLTGNLKIEGTLIITDPAGSTSTIKISSQPFLIDLFDGVADRVQIGKLAANGVSPAQTGIRVNDATNTPIFDTIGLFGDRVMKSLGIGNGNNQSFTTTTFTAITNASVTFTIPAGPQTNIFAPFLATGRVNTNNGNIGQVRANLVGVTTSGNLNFGVLANFAQTSTGWIFITNINPGTYTIQLEGNVGATPQTFDVFSNAVQVFKLGGA